jgi:hypothetical protein
MAMLDGLTPTGNVAEVGTVTVRVDCAVMFPGALAVMVTVPAPTAVRRPLLLIVATAELDELHVTCEVTFPIVPLDCEPVA